MPTYCVPDISGVPGSNPAEFDWWTVAVDPNSLRFSPENPDWLGSFSLSEGVGANRHLHFRVLRGDVGGQPHLFLSWVMRASDNQLAIDRLNVVLGDGTNYVALQVRLNTGASTVAGTQNAGTFTYRLHSCAVSGGGVITTTGVATTDGAALETTGRMWVDTTSPQRQLHTRWGFQLAIPLGAAWAPTALNIPLSDAFKLWYEAWASVGMNAVPYDTFTAPVGVQTTSVFEIVPATGTPLNTSHMLDMTTAAAGCATGVELNWGSVGVRNVDGTARPPGQIQLDLGKAYPPNNAPYNTSHTPNVALPQFQNQFFAVPANIAGLSVAQREALRARFSLANWGSQYSTGTASSWRPVPGGEDVNYTTANGEARFVWPTVADSYTTTLVRNINKFLNGGVLPPEAQNPHQCMLVELSSTDPTVVITRSSVYTNMNVASASTFRRLAEISVVGLDPIATPARDVYLYLQTFNMPKVVKDGDGRPSLGNQGFLNDSHATFSAVGSQERPREVEEVAAFYPTYIVHAYHDTGRKLKLEDGSQVPILEPQTSFGYFMQHAGDLVGWETRIYDAEKISETLYRLAVPHKGSRYVETAIQARESASEPPLPPDGIDRGTGPQTHPPHEVDVKKWPWWLWLLLALLVLLLLKVLF
ncbi:MAG TPA: hypothetical protein VFT45_06155 [Longimicrobium sp.]|nr:hypothetical protein [Longimicrobium sp.]